jgi:uncharacterized phage protein (TIGR01671 family)
MSRQIKFRAWDSKRKVLLSPDQLCHLEGNMSESIAERSPYLTLLQFTGLQDKAGRDIYEGDIVMDFPTVLTPVPRVVIFSKGSFIASAGEDEMGPFDYCFIHEGLEVIGNVYENPELITHVSPKS